MRSPNIYDNISLVFVFWLNNSAPLPCPAGSFCNDTLLQAANPWFVSLFSLLDFLLSHVNTSIP
jgi:hypothetical protein